MFQISHSKIRSWRTCKRQAHYRYVERLEPRKKPKPLMLGSILHSAMEERIEGGNPLEAIAVYEKEYGRLFREEQELYGDIIGESKSIIARYSDVYKKDPLKYLKIKGRRSEHPFEIKLAPDIILIGKLDSIVQTPKDGRVWAMEHKSKKTIPDEDERFFDIQTAMYTEFPAEFGIKKFDGVLWDYLRKKIPTVPELLKKGGLSQAKSIDTIPQVYMQAILDNNLDPAEYAEILRELEGREKNFFKRYYMPRNKVLGKRLVEEAVITGRDMAKNLGTDNTRTIDRHCNWCSFKLLCRTELLGLDADFVRKHEYKPREKIIEEDTEKGTDE